MRKAVRATGRPFLLRDATRLLVICHRGTAEFGQSRFAAAFCFTEDALVRSFRSRLRFAMERSGIMAENAWGR